jgi:hypothetical protein
VPVGAVIKKLATPPSTNAATAEISSIQTNYPVPIVAVNRLFNAVEQIPLVAKIVYLRVNYNSLLLILSTILVNLA